MDAPNEVQCLLQSGAIQSLDCKDNKGFSPLYYAAVRGKEDEVVALLENHATLTPELLRQVLKQTEGDSHYHQVLTELAQALCAQYQIEVREGEVVDQVSDVFKKVEKTELYKAHHQNLDKVRKLVTKQQAEGEKPLKRFKPNDDHGQEPITREMLLKRVGFKSITQDAPTSQGIALGRQSSMPEVRTSQVSPQQAIYSFFSFFTDLEDLMEDLMEISVPNKSTTT